MKKKLIKRCQPGNTIEKSDNTRVVLPLLEVEDIYDPTIIEGGPKPIDYSPGMLQVFTEQLLLRDALAKSIGYPTSQELDEFVNKVQNRELDWRDYEGTPYGDYYNKAVLLPQLKQQSYENYKKSGAITPVYPEFDLLTLGRSLWTMPKWSYTLPKGNSTTVYRLGGYDMLDDAINSGVVKPISKEHAAALRAADKAANPNRRIMLRKSFENNVMFNRKYPFYSWTPTKNNRVTFVGDMNKSNAQWILNFHKGHKNIFEPYMNGSKQAPLSEFRVFTSAPFKFGWYETPMKNSFHLPVFGLSPALSEE